MHMHCLTFVAALALMAGAPGAGASEDPHRHAASMEHRFADYGASGTWLVRRAGAATEVVHGNALADTAHPPASSIKPLLALVALETGALTDPEEEIPWDGRPYPNFPEWQTAMALEDAMRTSSESYFRTLAERIGHDVLAQWVARIGYGNGEIGEQPQTAWHDGSLQITATQQMDFIDRLRQGTLPFSQATLDTMRAAMFSHEHAGTRIFGKTGTHWRRAEGTGVGWWIGWTEGDEPGASFVLMVELDALDGRDRRIRFADRLLMEAGLIDDGDLR